MMATRRLPFLATLLAVALASVAAAQTPPTPPTDSQLERERPRIDAQRKAMFSKALLNKRETESEAEAEAFPSAAALERETRQVDSERKQIFAKDSFAADKPGPQSHQRTTPNNFPRIDTPVPSDIDIQALAKRYEGKAQSRKRDGLMVFASFAMPKESLKRAVVETNRAGGVVVMRGFKDGSIKATSKAVRELAKSSGTVQINPKAFTKYRIERVPAVVLAKPGAGQVLGEDGCALPSDYVMVYGDVALSYALERIERSVPAFSEMASRFGRPLKQSLPGSVR